MPKKITYGSDKEEIVVDYAIKDNKGNNIYDTYLKQADIPEGELSITTGSGLSLDETTGVLTAEVNKSYVDTQVATKSNVAYTQTLTSGTELGKITIDGTQTTIYGTTEPPSYVKSATYSDNVLKLTNQDDIVTDVNIPDTSSFITKDVDNLTNYTDTTTLNTELATKQDKVDGEVDITIGDGLSLSEDGVLSATGGSGTSDYTALSNKPTINSVELNGNKTSTELGLQSEITSTNKLSTSLIDGLSSVATSGSYNDLSDKPTIPTVDVTKSYVDTELAKKQDTLSTTQLNATNSGITSSKVSTYDGYASIIDGKSTVSASSTGTSTTEAKYLTIDKTEWKLAEGNQYTIVEISSDSGTLTTDQLTLINDGTKDVKIKYNTFLLSLTDVDTTTSTKIYKGLVSVDTSSYITGVCKVSTTNGQYAYATATLSKPTKTSQLTNDSGYITSSVSDLTNYTTTTDLNTELATKQDIVDGEADISLGSTLTMSDDNTINVNTSSLFYNHNITMTLSNCKCNFNFISSKSTKASSIETYYNNYYPNLLFLFGYLVTSSVCYPLVGITITRSGSEGSYTYSLAVSYYDSGSKVSFLTDETVSDISDTVLSV